MTRASSRQRNDVVQSSQGRRRRRRNVRTSLPRVQSEWVPIGSITRYSDNPRINEHTVPYLAQSIESFGMLVPIVVDGDGEIVAGDTRHKAMELLGHDEVLIIRATHLNDTQIRAFRLIDNKLNELSGWDDELHRQEVQAVTNLGVDLVDYGYTEEERDCMQTMVDDDCLSTPVTRRRANRRDTTEVKITIGEFVTFVNSEVYDDWADEVRGECDYDPQVISQHIISLLGMETVES